MSDHTHNYLSPAGNKLKYGILLTALVFLAEVAGGLLSNSLALLSDAGHVFTDILALSLSWYGVKQAERPPSSRMTFGYHRVGVIIALVNALSIFLITGFIFYEAYQRWQKPEAINSPLMLVVAILGLSVNIFVAFWLRKDQTQNLNIRSAFWHAYGDALASIGVIIGGVIIFFTNYYIVDPIISVFIGGIIAIAAWRILNEGLAVLLEATPQQVNVGEMIKALKEVPGVKNVHDTHIWSISPEIHSLSSHVLIDDLLVSQSANIRKNIEEMLQKRFHIDHTTLQMECQECSPDTFCQLVIGQEGQKENKQH